MIVRELITRLGFEVETSKFQQFDRQIETLSNKLNEIDRGTIRMLDGLGRLGRQLTLAVSVPLAVAGVSSVKAAADVEQLSLSFEVMLGSATKGANTLKELFAFAATTPFEIKEIGPTAKQLLAMGIESEKLISTMRILGNAAAGLNVPISRLALNYGQVRSQSKLTGRELRDFTIAGVPLLDTLAEILGKSVSEITDLVSRGEIGFPLVEEAFTRMSSEGGRFNNLMERMSMTLGGVFSNFLDATYLARVEIGKVIVETLDLTNFIRKLNTGLAAGVKWFTGLSYGAKKFIVYSGLFLISIGPILVALAAVGKGVVFIHSGLLLLRAGLLAAAGGGMAFNASMLVLPALIFAVLAVFALFVDEVYTWVNGGDTLLGKLIGPWEKWRDGIKDVLKTINDSLDVFFDALFTGKWDLFISKLEHLDELIRSIARHEFNFIKKVAGFIPGASIPVAAVEQAIKGSVFAVEGISATAGMIAGSGNPFYTGRSFINENTISKPPITINNQFTVPGLGTPGTQGSAAAEDFLAQFNRQLRHALSIKSPGEE